MPKKRTLSGTKKQQKSTKKNVLCSNESNNNSKKKKVKRINYDPENIDKALKAMNDTGLSLRKAAAAYGIPVATLGRKKNIDPEKIKSKTGPETVLSKEEEYNIVKWVLYRAEIGAPVTKTELLDSVQKYVQATEKKTPFTDGRPSRHWYEGFRKRHPDLSIRKPQHLSLSRAAVSQEDLQDWFENSGKYLARKNLLNIPPSRIFNCDESSILLCPDAESVLVAKGTRTVYKIVDGDKEALTVLFMYRADGTRAPPMLMYSYKKSIPKKIIDNTPTGWGIGVSDSGWMTTETFYEYITNVFYPWLVKENTEFPVIVYMDNHSSHLNLPLVTFCREKQIELIMLPPNSTHIMQPLDISFFHPFKETWKKCVPKWKNQYGVAHIKKEDFPLVLQFTLDNMKNAEKVVVSGFRGSGLYPFNPKAVDYDILNKTKKSKQTLDTNNSHDTNNSVEKGQFLQLFEQSLPEETLSNFKEAAMNGSWTGDLEKKALFDYWFDIYKKSTDIGITLKQKPVIKKIEILNDITIQCASQDNLKTNQRDSSNGIDSNINSSTYNSCIIDEERSTNFGAIDLVNCDEELRSVIILKDDFNMIDCEQNVGNNYELLYELPVQISSKKPLSDINNTLKTLTDLDKNNCIDLNVSLDNRNSDFLSQNDTMNIELTVNNSITNQNHQMELIKQGPTNVCETNNGHSPSNEEISSVLVGKDDSQKRPFKEIFTLPVEYLPKKKRNRLEKTGKSKLPSVGTSDEWYNLHLEKENIKKKKEKKQKNKKNCKKRKRN